MLILIIALLIVCCAVSIKDALKRKNTGDKIQSAVLTVVTVLIAIGTYLLSANPETITVVVPELSKLTEENENLKSEVESLQQKVIDQEDEIDSKDNELENLRSSLNYNAEFYNYKLYLNDDQLGINTTNSIAKINEKLFFSQDVIENITGESVKEDVDNSFIYIGKYPEEKVDLLSVSDPYNIDDGFELGENSPFKIQGNTYSNGFSLQTYWDDVRTVSFNLGSKYTELTFNMGQIDEGELDSVLTLTAYLESKDNISKQIVCDIDTSIESEQSIPLNNARVLILEWRGNESSRYTEYGLINLKLK